MGEKKVRKERSDWKSFDRLSKILISGLFTNNMDL